ncbi:MAG: SAM-dependent methyltransferase, partial [Terriglobales bacterium]
AMDVSFISATLVLPAVVNAVFESNAAAGGRATRAGPCELVVLVKPQFEAGRGQVGKGGIVRDPAVQAEAVERVRQRVVELGALSTDSIESPIRGAQGNREFLLYAVW